MNDNEVKNHQGSIKQINDLLSGSDPETRVQVLGSAIALEFLNQFGYEALSKFRLYSKNIIKIMKSLRKNKR